ncbi:golgin subfamily A member 1 isoform X1 [Scleropages formosus]|uniref:Golgin subfamily A member 1 n=1 Tax=Scleropages formosus TaxID=113540 RepID=A0A8C9RGB0_SCLFO|nr:golgin subfamily A member 1 isoform X1 [Scleropages formosus]
MFAKLKKKIAEEAATGPRPGGRMPRSISKESITSIGADSGDDFASDGSSSRDDLPFQLLRRNGQIRKLEAKLSDYAEQLRLLQKTKEKLEIALEKHQDSSMKKLQEQNETYQANRAKMAEGMALALEKKDQEWMDKMALLEKEKVALSSRLNEMMEQSLSLFQKRDDLDELEGFQQQELAKVKHMLLRKEELLGQKEKELQQQARELQTTQSALADAQDKLRLLEEEWHESSQLQKKLQAEREELLGVRLQADKKISEMEGQTREFRDLIQQLSKDLETSQSSAASLEQSLHSLQAEHEVLKLQHEQHKQKVAMAEEEKDRLVLELQEKVSCLERRLQGNLTEDEHLKELLKEKCALEQKVEETRAELLEARTSHAGAVSSLEAQISRLKSTMAELQTLLRTRNESLQSLRENSEVQVTALQLQVQESQEKLKSSEQQMADKETHIQQLQAEWSVTSERLQQQCQEKVARLEAQVTTLEMARDIDRTTTQHRISELEQEKENLLSSKSEMESLLNRTAEELEQARAELDSRQTVSVEIAKALEETRRQKEELQEQVGDMATALSTRQDELAKVTEQLGLREEELQVLQEELRTTKADLSQLRAEAELRSREVEQREAEMEAQLVTLRQEVHTKNQQLDTWQSRVSDLELEVEALTEQQQPSAGGEMEQNGAVTADDLAHVQTTNKELEQQLMEKNKTIKQLQQRLAELKRTLQKELKLKPEMEPEVKEKRQDVKADKPERPEKPCPENPVPTPGPSTTTITTTVTNNADLNDSREINFEYLKHVVLKFMSSREAEAYQLIKAVSVLLNFTREEENMLKETLEYKMSWFGSKPSPKGIIRPSISGTPTHWS